MGPPIMHQTPNIQHSRCPSLSKSNCLFFTSALTLAAGVVTIRHSLHSFFFKPISSSFSLPNHSKISSSTFQTAMYGGGTGVSVPARAAPTATMIFLHGLGDSGDGWAPAFPLQGLDYVQTVLPSADSQPVTMNMRYRMPSWFDIHGLEEDSPDDEVGLLSSVDRLDRIVDEQVRNGIPEHRIIVAGFSQGGAVALTYALRTERKLAGIVALSTWLPLVNKYPAQLSVASKDLELFMGHGTADNVVSLRFGEKSANLMQAWDRRISFKSYPGLTHSASPAEMEDVRQFIARVLPKE